MPVMMQEIKVWAEEGGVELLVAPSGGVLEVSILRDGQIAATATIARYRWSHIVQAVSAAPPDLT